MLINAMSTQFAPGDTVFVNDGACVYQDKIVKVIIDVTMEGIDVRYEGEKRYHSEDDLFESPNQAFGL